MACGASGRATGGGCCVGIGRGRGDHGSKVTSGGEQARWTHGIEAFRSVGGSLSHGRATGGRMPRSHHDFFSQSFFSVVEKRVEISTGVLLI